MTLLRLGRRRIGSWISLAFVMLVGVLAMVSALLMSLAPGRSRLSPHWRYRSAWLSRSSNLQGTPEPSEEGQSELSSIEEQVSAAATGMGILNEPIMEAAAFVTQESCELLGVKSIGVDYGLARTGVAVSVGYEPQPLVILSDMNSTDLVLKVVTCCSAEQAKQIIVGLPIHKNGTENNQTILTRAFASELSCYAMARLGPSVPVYLFDERYTSKEAAARAHSRHPDRNLYKVLDAEAACIILENYYSDNGKGAERVHVPEHMLEACQNAWEAAKADGERKTQAIQEHREANLRRRQEAIERARKLESEMEQSGIIGLSRKKKKKRKKKK